ncbi:uncharacterized protein B0H18DRAFT_1084426 [Fomitopsis serialis]|uniref:uncharacterized protein n=1 Tax=Fomitopsis serialis TaxID=139415 RepID=UPI002007BCBD|nr:uncharacterized protein B0H18DRAFT_1084426 [Neoantrodia serialis]KAH9928691.1 hypothetical protein B0H18DRAFT_1084426 [Neoantrodia serialis]
MSPCSRSLSSSRGGARATRQGPPARPGTPQQAPASAGPGSARQSSPAMLQRRPFTRSRSPAVNADQNGFSFSNQMSMPGNSPSSIFSRQKIAQFEIRHLLPSFVHATFRPPFSSTSWKLTLDLRQTFETSLLICSLGYCATKMRGCLSPEMWISIELALLIIASMIYFCVTRIYWNKLPPSDETTTKQTNPQDTPASPGLVVRDNRRTSNLIPNAASRGSYFGFVWMTVPKNYRDSADDGMLFGLLTGPLMSAALLYLSEKAAAATPPLDPLPQSWIIEQPKVLDGSNHPLTALQALVLSRRNLVDMATVCSTIIIVHVIASWMTERRHRRKLKVPRANRRTYLSILFTVSVSLWVLCVRIALSEMRLGIWQMVCFGATVLLMEALSLTIARISPITTSFIKTYRLPTPLLIYQIALIPGSLLVGVLLSPLLYLSRHIAQQPVRRLRYPEQKQKHRRLLALGFYAGAVLIVGGLIGLWTRWLLGSRDPWLWALFWILEGKTKWSRPALLAYWAALGSISVAGWSRQLARSRRYRHRNVVNAAGEFVLNHHGSFDGGVRGMNAGQREGGAVEFSDPSAPPTPPPESAGPLGLSFSNLPNLSNLSGLPNGANMSNVADWLDAADKHVPTLSVNARRKFFHALAVAMFLPGIAIDPAFTHLAFSAAFALFVFAEYFLDQKDSGTAILSHFYLLIGCAGTAVSMLQYTGTLVLGVGDALASIAGKRLGRHRWLATSPKTLEGSAAFVVSIVACAWMLRLCGLSEHFSILRYSVVAGLSSALEAFSVQNDNVLLPLYMWSMLVFADV